MALRQRADQSSTFGDWVAENAVNGKLGTVNGGDHILSSECTHTNEGNSRKGSWTVTFSQPALFGKIVIYNRRNPNRGGESEELGGFKRVV